jgi:CRP-like cAMP-binding protein
MADLRKLRESASAYIAKGKFAKAADVLGEIVRIDPRDLPARQKLAEVLRRAGDDAEAIRVYREVADRYAAHGQLIKAVAICKIILEIDPAHLAMQAALADLYARRSGAPTQAPPPPPSPSEQSSTGTTLPPMPLEKIQAQPLAAELMPSGPRYAPVDSPESPYEKIVANARQAQASGVRDPITLELQLEQVVPEEPPPVLMRSPPAPAPPPAAPVAVGRVALAPAPPPPPAAPPPEPVPMARLPRIPLFSDLSHDAFMALAQKLSLHQVGADEVILREGDVGSSFFVVASGRVRVEKSSRDGAVVLAHLGEGAFFGEIALLSGAQRVASVISEEPCELLEIRAEVLADLSRSHPHVAGSLTKFYRERLLANVLATSPLFKPFPRDDRLALMHRFRSRELLAGELLVREGEPSDGLYVVLSGEVDVTMSHGGQEVLVARLAEGDVFGETSCLRKGPATATVRVRRRATLLWLSRAVFDEVVVSYPPVLALVAELSDQRGHALQTALLERHGEVAGGPDEPILL